MFCHTTELIARGRATSMDNRHICTPLRRVTGRSMNTPWYCNGRWLLRGPNEVFPSSYGRLTKSETSSQNFLSLPLRPSGGECLKDFGGELQKGRGFWVSRSYLDDGDERVTVIVGRGTPGCKLRETTPIIIQGLAIIACGNSHERGTFAWPQPQHTLTRIIPPCSLVCPSCCRRKPRGYQLISTFKFDEPHDGHVSPRAKIDPPPPNDSEIWNFIR